MSVRFLSVSTALPMARECDGKDHDGHGAIREKEERRLNASMISRNQISRTFGEHLRRLGSNCDWPL